MGLLSAKDWTGNWVSAPALRKSTQMPIFRKSFTIDRPVSRAMVFYCGLGQHELHLNGQIAGQEIIDPGWTNYKKSCLYATQDVTALLKQGENVIGMMLGNGMYNVIGGRYAKFKGSFGEPKFILQMQIEFADKTSMQIISDESWTTSPGPITFS